MKMNIDFWPKNPKPNFQNAEMNITSAQLTVTNHQHKNKPNSNPIYPELVEGIKANKVPFFVMALLVLFAVSCSKRPANTVSGANEKAESNQQASDTNVQSPNNSQDPNVQKPARPAPIRGGVRPEHKHPAFTERIKERARMVASQIKARDVNDPNVLKAMQTVPRHAFVQHPNKNIWSSNLERAYADHPLPIGFDQTISQPYIVAFMTEAMELRPDYKVLEIGTGSGYQAAVCAEIAQEVYTIEIVEPLAKRSEKLLKELGYKNVFVKAGDGFFGWPEKAPFDAIIGTAAAERIPEPLIEQLKQDGRMIIPYEDSLGFQHLVMITRDEKGELQKKNVMPVRFVPMTGEVQKKQR